MLITLAVANYRSINQLIVPLARLNLITGPNGSGKSNLYRALRLLAETAKGGVVNALAREGGLESTFWAGPEVVSRRMKSGEVAIEGGPRNKVKRLRMGFAADDFSYAIALGVSPPELSAFTLDPQALHSAISDAFPGARLEINALPGGRFAVEFYQEGLLRPLSAAELSDGTLRYLLLVAALLTPRPPTLMVLNEPETSLHPDLLPALARLIIRTSLHSQVWVVSHARRLIAALQQDPECNCIVLEKNLGQTEVVGQRMLDQPAWHWAD
ncbi:AAA family ATPase [Pseudomonas helleri]|uniref:AAA family ATPase n=1 Tax=Pseudomonas helleri TaxID=1608996 RepID=UPI0037F85A2D